MEKVNNGPVKIQGGNSTTRLEDPEHFKEKRTVEKSAVF